MVDNLRDTLRADNRWKGWYSVNLGCGSMERGDALDLAIPPYEALAGVDRWNGLSWLKVVVFDAKLGTGERQVALALGPTDDEYNESVLCVGDGGLWLPKSSRWLSRPLHQSVITIYLLSL